jgi:histidyl-tRNA synthetase
VCFCGAAAASAAQHYLHRFILVAHISTLINLNAGTRDFYPEEMRLRNWLFGQWSDVARLYGFEQFDVPVLESEELFTRKAGEEITEQLYNFEVRQAGARAVWCCWG